jgi:hypothetical protein
VVVIYAVCLDRIWKVEVGREERYVSPERMYFILGSGFQML